MPQACVLAVPKVHILYKGRDDYEHLRYMGYKQVERPGDAKSGQNRHHTVSSARLLYRLRAGCASDKPSQQSVGDMHLGS